MIRGIDKRKDHQNKASFHPRVIFYLSFVKVSLTLLSKAFKIDYS